MRSNIMFCAPEIDPSGLDAVSISVDYIAIYSYSYVPTYAT